MSGLTWPPARLPLTGGETVPTLQGNKIVGAPASAFGSGGGGGGGAQIVASYAALRTGAFNASQPLFLVDQHKGGMFVSGPLARDNGGTILNDSVPQSWYRVFDKINAGWFYNGPGYFGDGYTDPVTKLPYLITAADQTANPQWIGMAPALGGGNYPVGTSWASVALQEATYACFAGTSVPGTVTWNVSDGNNFPLFVPAGTFRTNVPWYFYASGYEIDFAQRKGTNLFWIGPNNQSPVMMDAISYGVMRNLSVQDLTGVQGLPLVDCNWTGANPGLKTQNLTFEHLLIYGVLGSHGCVGFSIARSGASSQGDTCTLINPGIFYVNQAIVMGGNNALNLTVIGGNIQGALRDGAMTIGGSFQYYNSSAQASAVDYHVYPQGCQINLDGAEAHIYPGGGQTSRCAIRDFRSEDIVLSLDQNTSTRIDNASLAQVYGFQGGWSAGQHQHIGTLIPTGGLINRVVVCADDGGPAWFPADTTSTNTVMVKQGPSPNWTPGQWVGFSRWFRYGNGYSFAGGPITASTANSVTDPNGWYTPEPPTIPLPNFAGYYIKVMGITGTTQPAWDTFPQGNYTITGSTGSIGYGFTVYAGSNVVSSNNPVPAGNYVLVCGAVGVSAPPGSVLSDGPLLGKVQNLVPSATFTGSVTAGVLTVSAMTTGTIKVGASLLGGGTWAGTQVISQTSGTTGGVGVYQVGNPQQPNVVSGPLSTQASFEVVSGIGEPLPATYSHVDSMGYWGAGILDGQVTWLPIDFNVIQGASSVDNTDIGTYGKLQSCGFVNVAFQMNISSMARFRPDAGRPNFSYRNGAFASLLNVNVLTTTATTTINTGQVATENLIPIGNALAAFTVVMPTTWLANVVQDVQLVITNQNAAAVLTWDTASVKAANPTVTLGGVGLVTIITLKWGVKPGFWVVSSIQGPY